MIPIYLQSLVLVSELYKYSGKPLLKLSDTHTHQPINHLVNPLYTIQSLVLISELYICRKFITETFLNRPTNQPLGDSHKPSLKFRFSYKNAGKSICGFGFRVINMQENHYLDFLTQTNQPTTWWFPYATPPLFKTWFWFQSYKHAGNLLLKLFETDHSHISTFKVWFQNYKHTGKSLLKLFLT